MGCPIFCFVPGMNHFCLWVVFTCLRTRVTLHRVLGSNASKHSPLQGVVVRGAGYVKYASVLNAHGSLENPTSRQSHLSWLPHGLKHSVPMENRSWFSQPLGTHLAITLQSRLCSAYRKRGRQRAAHDSTGTNTSILKRSSRHYVCVCMQ